VYPSQGVVKAYRVVEVRLRAWQVIVVGMWPSSWAPCPVYFLRKAKTLSVSRIEPTNGQTELLRLYEGQIHLRKFGDVDEQECMASILRHPSRLMLRSQSHIVSHVGTISDVYLNIIQFH
jgi:uncharacterized protein (UPF0179 family)